MSKKRQRREFTDEFKMLSSWSPNRVWTADISYVWTFEGWLYLAIIMDLYSGQIVGWAMDKRMKKDLALNDTIRWPIGKESLIRGWCTTQIVEASTHAMSTENSLKSMA